MCYVSPAVARLGCLRAIYILAVSDSLNFDGLSSDVQFVQDSIVTNANAVRVLRAGKFLVTMWEWFAGKCFGRGDDARDLLPRKFAQVLLRRRAPLKLKGCHLASIRPQTGHAILWVLPGAQQLQPSRPNLRSVFRTARLASRLPFAGHARQ